MMRDLVAECRGCGQCNVPVRAPPCWRLLLTVMGGVRWVRLLGATTDPSSASQRGLGGRLEHGWEAVRQGGGVRATTVAKQGGATEESCGSQRRTRETGDRG
jgi:hypothetical protein